MWIEIGQDGFAQNLIDRWALVTTSDKGERSDGFTFVRRADGLTTVEVGPVGTRLLRGYRQAVGALARAGNDVVVDEAKFDDDGWTEWSSSLHGLPVTWVRVECDLSVCEDRERSRVDRSELHGLARGIYDRVHADAIYDLVVDTTHASPTECADTVLAFVEAC